MSLGAQAHGTSAAAFQATLAAWANVCGFTGALARNWIRRGAARALTDAHTRCQHHKQHPLLHNSRPRRENTLSCNIFDVQLSKQKGKDEAGITLE